MSELPDDDLISDSGGQAELDGDCEDENASALSLDLNSSLPGGATAECVTVCSDESQTHISQRKRQFSLNKSHRFLPV